MVVLRTHLWEEQTSELGLRLLKKGGGCPALCSFSRRSRAGDAQNPRLFPVMMGKSDELQPQCPDLRGDTFNLDLGPQCLRRAFASLLVLVPTKITCPCPSHTKGHYWGGPERSRNREEGTDVCVTSRLPVALQRPHWPNLPGSQKGEGKWNWQSSVSAT